MSISDFNYCQNVQSDNIQIVIYFWQHKMLVIND